MEHFVQKFADGSTQEMVRAFASIPFVAKSAGFSDAEFSKFIEDSPAARELLLAEYLEAIRLL